MPPIRRDEQAQARRDRIASALREVQEQELSRNAENLRHEKELADERAMQDRIIHDLTTHLIPGFLKMMNRVSGELGPPYRRRRGVRGWPVATLWRQTPKAMLPDCTVIVENDGQLLRGHANREEGHWSKIKYGSHGVAMTPFEMGRHLFTGVAERRYINPPVLLRLDAAFDQSIAAYLDLGNDEIHWPGVGRGPSLRGGNAE